MSAIFDFSSLMTVLLLIICTCAYIRELRPTIFDGGLVSITFLSILSKKFITPENQSVINHYLSFIISLSNLDTEGSKTGWATDKETGFPRILLEIESHRWTFIPLCQCILHIHGNSHRIHQIIPTWKMHSFSLIGVLHESIKQTVCFHELCVINFC